MIVHDNHPKPRCCKQNVCWTQVVFSAQCHVSFSQVHLNQFLQVIEKECCLARGNISPEKIFRPALHCKPVTSGCWKSIPAKEKAAALCKVIEILQWAGPSTACVRLTKFCKGKTLSSPHSPSFGEVYSVHVSLKFWTIDRNSTSSKARFQVLIIYLIRWTAAIPFCSDFLEQVKPPTKNVCCRFFNHFRVFNQGLPTQLTRPEVRSSGTLSPVRILLHVTSPCPLRKHLNCTERGWNKEKRPASARLFVQTSSACRLVSFGYAAMHHSVCNKP